MMHVHQEWLLTPFRAVVHVPTATAVSADWHLGYDAARRAAGEAIPSFGLQSVQKRLATLVEQFGPRRLIVAGDLVENAMGWEAAARVARWLAARRIEFGLVPGNHDRGQPDIAGLDRHSDGFRLGEWLVLHEGDPAVESPQITGHLHPVLRCRGLRGQAACYLVSERRIVLPAFSDDAAGLNVLGSRHWRTSTCLAIAGDNVLDLGPVRRLRDRLHQAASFSVFP